MSDSVQRRWKVLSLVLFLGLIVSLTWNVYSTFFVGSTSEAANVPFEFSFAWSNGSQRIVNGTFRLSLKMWLSGENLTMMITANDDEFDGGDYVGLVFDTNQNGYVDFSDESYGLFACNRTGPSDLGEDGLLAWAQVPSRLGPQNVTYDPLAGYTFVVQFPFPWYSRQWNPAQVIRNGTYNQLHICYFDMGAEEKGQRGAVFARFAFYTKEAE